MPVTVPIQARIFRTPSSTASQEDVDAHSTGAWHFVRWIDLGAGMSIFTCDCKGYSYNRRCAHIDRVKLHLSKTEGYRLEQSPTVIPNKEFHQFMPQTDVSVDDMIIPDLADLMPKVDLDEQLL